MTQVPSPVMDGLLRDHSRFFLPQLQTLRNQRVGRTWMGAAFGPWLVMVIRHRMSSGVRLATSCMTSKYFPSSKIPVSASSSSGPLRPSSWFFCVPFLFFFFFFFFFFFVYFFLLFSSFFSLSFFFFLSFFSFSFFLFFF